MRFTRLRSHLLLHPAALLAGVFTLPSLSHASGFQLQERSAAGLGRAFSAEAAMGDDASVVASNPAGMLLLNDRWSFTAGASAIFPDVETNGRYQPPGAPAGFTVAARSGNIADTAYLPYLYAAHRLTDDISLGFGTFTAFGLGTDYPASFSARAVADLSKLKTLHLNPSVAWRITPQWSVGAGYNAVRAEGSLNSTLPNGLPLLDLGGKDWGHGFNVGVLYEATEHTRLGLHYRSPIDLTIEGRAISVNPAFNGPGMLELELPATVEFSAVHDIGDWSVHGDALWTDWSSFQQLAPHIIGAPAQPPVTRENWKDTWRFSAGVTWRATDTWTFRAGAAYDHAPVNEADLTLRIPDADRIWLTAGFSWEFRPCWTLDFGYAHIFADDVRVSDGSAATGLYTGTVSGSADVVSIGISTSF